MNVCDVINSRILELTIRHRLRLISQSLSPEKELNREWNDQVNIKLIKSFDAVIGSMAASLLPSPVSRVLTSSPGWRMLHKNTALQMSCIVPAGCNGESRTKLPAVPRV
jgi:hypothetical protein